MRTTHRLAAGLLGATLGASVLAGVVGVVPASAAADDPDCSSTSTSSGEAPVATSATGQSLPLTEMDVAAAQRFLTTQGGQTQAGQGVTVAVLDSGVTTAGTRIPVSGVLMAGALQTTPTFYHGTDIAGLIAGGARSDAEGGAVGVAPGAQILDVRVYDDPGDDPGSPDGSPITSENVADGLQQVLGLVTAGNPGNIKVVAVPLELPLDSAADQRIADLITQLWQAGVVTVAPAGNRPQSGSTGPLPSELASASPGENAAADVYPAHAPDALVAGSSMTGAGDAPAQTYLLQNSDVDVATPTAGGVSYSVSGGTCVNAVPATSWATAYVAGVLALDQSYFDETPARAVSRLVHTANGRPDIPNDLVGAGELQPLAALTRPLQMDADGTVLNAPMVEPTPQVVRAPTTPPDVLASTRRNAVWWGLFGGGALLVALVLRPVLARRRA